MASLQECSVGIIPEVTWGTPLTVTRWAEFTSESLDFNKAVKQGMGLRVGSRVARSPRRVVATSNPQGDVEFELCSKGMGLWWQVALGTGVSTLVSGSTQQQLFTLSTAALAPSVTIQKGVVELGGTVDPYTYAGMTCGAVEITCPKGDIAKAKFSFLGKSLATATGYTAPSYPAAPVNLFHFAQGAITVGGAVTAPTTTAMASGGTAVANVRDFSLKIDNGLAGDRFNLGGAGLIAQPTYGLRAITGNMTIEYDSTTIRDAYIADTPLAVTLTFTTGTALSTGFEQFQIVLPEIKLDGDIPNANGTDLITLNVPFTVLDNLTAAQPIWIAQRTADAAL
jgi:hypothetical protein